jgi:shikimate dehydrogenase
VPLIRPVQSDLFAVIGHPVAHSLSPAMMNAAFRSLKIPATYVALDADSLQEDLRTLADVGFRGLSVTIPHKESALRLAAEVDETAAAIGAVNTLKLRNGKWEGRNTDWLGAVQALKRETALHSRKSLVIGAGGAARAVAFGLRHEGAPTTITNRTRSRGEDLARALECDFMSMETLAGLGGGHGFDIVVQCTSVGLPGKDSVLPLPESFLVPGMVVMDIVYRPIWTPFLGAAAQRGCRVVKGYEMLLHQGVAQLEWWLERSIPEEVGVRIMRSALEKALIHDSHD